MKKILKYLGLWFVCALILHILISKIFTPELSSKIFFPLSLLLVFGIYFYNKSKAKPAVKEILDNDEHNAIKPKIELIPKGDIVKFEYETERSNEPKFFSGKLIDIEFDCEQEWGTHTVLIGETSKGSTKRFKSYDLLG